MNIGENISKAIKESKWLSVAYINQNNFRTLFWMAVLDINITSKEFLVSIFKYNKESNYDTIRGYVKFDSIVFAEVLEYTSYDRPDMLITKIEDNIENLKWLKYDHFSYNILNYYMDCSRLDCDPVQKNYTPIPGIDIFILRRNSSYPLTDQQIKTLINDVFLKDMKKIENKDYTLVINKLSIDKGDKKYVVCYYELLFDPQQRSLVIDNELHTNSGFMVEGRRNSIQNYINMDVEEFETNFEAKQKEFINIIAENLWHGEYINSRPEIMLLEREFEANLYPTFTVIEEKYKHKQLPVPLKSFFGNISKRKNCNNRNEPALVIYDERINVNQMHVLYSSLKYPVTFVKGPPGTGKTQTILNIIMSAFYNNKTMLVCSSNNKPVDSLLEKLKFTYNGYEIPFPYIRLGNNANLGEATKRIKELYEMSTAYDNNLNETLENLKLEDIERHKRLIELLKVQEQRIEIQTSIECNENLIRWFGEETSTLINRIRQETQKLRMKLNELPEITNDDLLGLYVPFKENNLSSRYFYYRSLRFINELKKPRYQELIDICSISKEKPRILEFNRWCSFDDNINKLTKVFPIIFSTNISTAKLGSPRFMFDMVVMDEAGQCNVATSLIPITKARSLVLIGDPNQLKPVIVLDEASNHLLMEKYHVSENFNYKKHSILDVMLNNDNISKYIMLRYHYRCGRKIINFSNQRYYSNNLDLSYVRDDGDIEMINVKNEQKNKKKNESIDEAEAIVKYIKRNNIKDASIVTPFVNQQKLLSKLFAKEKINGIHCGTIHSLQGAEKDTIIFSLAISEKTRKRTYDWINENPELINVAVTRAKKKLIIAGDNDAVRTLSSNTDDISNLIRYSKSNGRIFVPPNESNRNETGSSSNRSEEEKEFYITISHFCSCHRNFKARRKVRFSSIVNLRDDESMATMNFEFDIVLYSIIGNRDIPEIAFEIDDSERIGRRQTNRIKEICENNHIELRTIKNSFVKDYENIMDFLQQYGL